MDSRTPTLWMVLWVTRRWRRSWPDLDQAYVWWQDLWCDIRALRQQMVVDPAWWGLNLCVSVCAHSVAQSCSTLCEPMDCSQTSSSVRGIFQERLLEWVAIPYSRGSSSPRNWTLVSLVSPALTSGFFTTAPPGKPRPWIWTWTISGYMVSDKLLSPFEKFHGTGFKAGYIYIRTGSTFDVLDWGTLGEIQLCFYLPPMGALTHKCLN